MRELTPRPPRPKGGRRSGLKRLLDWIVDPVLVVDFQDQRIGFLILGHLHPYGHPLLARVRAIEHQNRAVLGNFPFALIVGLALVVARPTIRAFILGFW